ncbi:hypothetical protein BP5796_10430 [Coleophoma crateriformis]|uniref:Uncharacterized protein n=1 Tax=Coleophoma crateriformis TaxID=565419 RepID=A0A3D8QQH2_9HELO|nr:hypothetical protein BP5796_10430 [Coleophoma crateriformis]
MLPALPFPFLALCAVGPGGLVASKVARHEAVLFQDDRSYHHGDMVMELFGYSSPVLRIDGLLRDHAAIDTDSFQPNKHPPTGWRDTRSTTMAGNEPDGKTRSGPSTAMSETAEEQQRSHLRLSSSASTNLKPRASLGDQAQIFVAYQHF